MKFARILITLLLVLFVGIYTVGAQNVLDGDSYKEAQELKDRAAEALDAGNLEEAVDLSRKSREVSERAYYEAQVAYYMRSAQINKVRVEEILDSTDRESVLGNAEIHNAIAIEDARAFYRDGVMLLDEGQYELSALAFDNAYTVLASIDSLQLLNEEEGVTRLSVTEKDISGAEDATPDAEMKDDAEMMAEEKKLPKYYRVRLIPSDRDSFSKIAAYPFVYGDYTQWPDLYTKNKDKIVDSSNPNLIHPGQLFEIPDRPGETRKGEWQPPDTQ